MPRFFDWLEANIDALLARDARGAGPRHPPLLRDQGRRSSARDEREQGERALLNLGHTFGHAIEAATGYGEWLHGEAVGAGMLMAAEHVAASAGCSTPRIVARLRALLRARRAADRGAAHAAPQRALDYMRIDKKVQAGRMRLVLLRRIGAAVVTGDYPRRRRCEAHAARRTSA